MKLTPGCVLLIYSNGAGVEEPVKHAPVCRWRCDERGARLLHPPLNGALK